MNRNKDCIKACNELLRGELAAVETYTQAVDKFDSPQERGVLTDILRDHLHSVDVLREHVVAMGGDPSDSSGLWGNFTQAIENTAKLLGETPALAVLEAGEKHGIAEYEDALEREGVMFEIKENIREDLLPRLSEHIQMLKQLAA